MMHWQHKPHSDKNTMERLQAEMKGAMSGDFPVFGIKNYMKFKLSNFFHTLNAPEHE